MRIRRQLLERARLSQIERENLQLRAEVEALRAKLDYLGIEQDEHLRRLDGSAVSEA